MNEIEVLVFPDSHEAEACGYNYKEWDKQPSSVRAVKAIIVLNGTQGGNPTVDIIGEDEAGKKHVFMMTGKLLAGVADAAFAGKLLPPPEVVQAAQSMKLDGYRGPYAWAKKIIDWVADR